MFAMRKAWFVNWGIMINKGIIDRVKGTLGNIEMSFYPTLKDVFQKNSAEIERLNAEAQLYDKGQDSKGISLQPYAQSTITIKLRKGQPTDRTTLRDTGDFHRSITVIAEDNQLVIESSIEYAVFLTSRYGKDILGVQDMNLSDFFFKYVQPEINTNIANIISNNKL